MTTDSASNNKKAFENYTCISCFGHNLHLDVGKVLGITSVSCIGSRQLCLPFPGQKIDQEFERETEDFKPTCAKDCS